MKRFISVLSIGAAVVLAASCNNNGLDNGKAVVSCTNGQFQGAREAATGVLSFKGVPYAKAPVGNLRWKAPEYPEKSSELFSATEYGTSSIQYYWHSEPIRTGVGEDYLTLNIWTSDLSTKRKPVMVFIHGGAYAWGGSSEEIYDGQYFVQANPDILLVSCNYRVGITGFANFRGVPGCEDYPDTENLGVMDIMMALRWLQHNAAQFGGDASNITVFGESSGGGIISAMLATDAAGALFQRAIVQSGAPNQVISKAMSDNHKDNVRALMEVTGATSMEALCKISETELIEANETPLDEDETTINDLYSLPVRGTGLIADDIYSAAGAAKVDLMIGTCLDEMAYWVNEMGDEPMCDMDKKGIETNLYLYENYFIAPAYDSVMEKVSPEVKKSLEEYMAMYSNLDELWARSRMLSDVFFRAPSIALAEEHSAKSTGRTYMYLFEKENDSFEFLGSCHATENPYVFLNPHHAADYGVLDMDLALKVNAAWANFARTGNPSASGAQWPEYDTSSRKTMIVGNDGNMYVLSDPYPLERTLTSGTVPYGLLPSGA